MYERNNVTREFDEPRLKVQIVINLCRTPGSDKMCLCC